MHTPETGVIPTPTPYDHHFMPTPTPEGFISVIPTPRAPYAPSQIGVTGAHARPPLINYIGVLVAILIIFPMLAQNSNSETS